MFKKLFFLIAWPVLLLVNSGCNSGSDWTGLYGISGHIFDSSTSNAIAGIRTVLFNNVIAVTNVTATNGYYCGYVYISGAVGIIYDTNLTNDFSLTVTDIDGNSNGSYQALTTNIGPVFRHSLVMDFYLLTN